MDWIPNPGAQTEILRRTEYELGFGGARGGGKSTAGLAWLISPEYLKNPQYRALVVRRNAEDLSDWIARARDFYKPLNARFAGNPPIIKFPSGAFIKTGHLKDENAFEKYQGHEYQKMVIEELTQIPREEDYLKLISSCRSADRSLKPQIFSTFNPGGSGHTWVKQRFVDVARNRVYRDPISGRTRLFIPSKIEDNPALMKADPDYVHYLDSLPDELRKAWREGNWEIFAGQYFKKLNRDKHIIEPFKIPDTWVRFRSLDWGYSHYSVCLWWAIDYNGNAYIYRHLSENETIVSRMAEHILEMTPKDEKIITTTTDPAVWVRNPYSEAVTDRTMADEMRKVGLFVEKANNDRLNGWQSLRELIEWDADTKPRLRIFSNCEAVFGGLARLIHDDKRPEDVLKIDGDDYGDSARYGAMHIFATMKKKRKLTEIEKFIEKIVDPLPGTNASTEWDDN